MKMPEDYINMCSIFCTVGEYWEGTAAPQWLVGVFVLVRSVQIMLINNNIIRNVLSVALCLRQNHSRVDIQYNSTSFHVILLY